MFEGSQGKMDIFHLLNHSFTAFKALGEVYDRHIDIYFFRFIMKTCRLAATNRYLVVPPYSLQVYKSNSMAISHIRDLRCGTTFLITNASTLLALKSQIKATPVFIIPIHCNCD